MSHANTPPTLPTVVDEAGDSPNWVPVLGLALFALVSLLVAIQFASQENTQTAQDTAEPEVAAPEQPAQPAE
jgi:hypothetical protein